MRIRAFAGIGVVTVVLLCGAAAKPATVDVTIIAINDLHGNLEPPPSGTSFADPAHPGKNFTVASGGVDRMATLVKRLRAQHRNSIFVAAGDLIGASPLLSSLFHDEPAIEAMSRMGLEVTSVGNHEFDKGLSELLRMQKGGCNPKDGCNGGHVFKGASFKYLAAGTVNAATGKTIFPPYYVKRFEGIPVAFIGLTRHETGGMVMPSASAGLEFRDEAETVNAIVPKLKAQGIEAIVVLIHLGATNAGGVNDCKDPTGSLLDVVPKFDKAVDVVVSADSHYPYICTIDRRLVTQAYRYSNLVTEIDLKLDRRTHHVVAKKAINLVVDPNLPSDPGIAKLVAHYKSLAGPLMAKVVATVPTPLLEKKDKNAELALGDLVADALLAAGDRAKIAFVNPGGVRVDIAKGGPVTHGDLFAVLPYNNVLNTIELTGVQLKAALEQQWFDPKLWKIMQISHGFSYSWDGTRPYGDHVLTDTMMLNGKPIRADATYRVAMPDFLAQGGDDMKELREGKNLVVGPLVLDALETWLPAHVPPNGDTAGRLKRVDAP